MNPFQLEEDLKQILDRYSTGGTTPPGILARYMLACLDAFNEATEERDRCSAPSSDPEGITAAAERFGKWPDGKLFPDTIGELQRQRVNAVLDEILKLMPEVQMHWLEIQPSLALRQMSAVRRLLVRYLGRERK